MARTLAEMVSKGRASFETKLPFMTQNYEEAKPRMIESFRALPFGPSTIGAYESGVRAATYRTPDVDKWGRNWQAAVSR